MAQPQGMQHVNYPHHVCRLHKTIYRLKQATTLRLGALHLLALSRLCHIPCGLVSLCLLPW